MSKERKPRSSPTETAEKRDLFLLWKSIPSLVRTIPQAELAKMGYDTDDPILKRLLECRTQTQFCTVFEVSINEPARWQKDEEFIKTMDRLSQHDHVHRFEKEIDFAFTQKTIREADAGRVKLWKQLYRGWTEKTENINTNRNLDMVELVKEIEKRNKSMREAKPTLSTTES
jgi:hypothetical protein